MIALPSQPENLNPILADNVYEGNPKFFNGLLRYAKDLSAEPDLARSRRLGWHWQRHMYCERIAALGRMTSAGPGRHAPPAPVRLTSGQSWSCS